VRYFVVFPQIGPRLVFSVVETHEHRVHTLEANVNLDRCRDDATRDSRDRCKHETAALNEKTVARNDTFKRSRYLGLKEQQVTVDDEFIDLVRARICVSGCHHVARVFSEVREKRILVQHEFDLEVRKRTERNVLDRVRGHENAEKA